MATKRQQWQAAVSCHVNHAVASLHIAQAVIFQQHLVDAGSRRMGSTALGRPTHAHGLFQPLVYCLNSYSRVCFQQLSYHSSKGSGGSGSGLFDTLCPYCLVAGACCKLAWQYHCATMLGTQCFCRVLKPTSWQMHCMSCLFSPCTDAPK